MSGDETIFTWGAPPLKFGWGASDEIGFDLGQYGAERVLILTDPGLAATEIPHRIADAMRRYGIAVEVFDGVRIEPTDESMESRSRTPPSTGHGTRSSPSAAAARSTPPRR